MAHPRIDAHIHLWGDDPVRYPFGSTRYPGDPIEPGPGPNGEWSRPDPPTPGQLDYYKQGTAKALLAAQAEVGVHAAHAISVVFHGYDDTYIEDTIAATPLRLRGSHVCDPSSTPEREVARLALLYDEKGFTGVRFKPNLCAASPLRPEPSSPLRPDSQPHPTPPSPRRRPSDRFSSSYGSHPAGGTTRARATPCTSTPWARR